MHITNKLQGVGGKSGKERYLLRNNVECKCLASSGVCVCVCVCVYVCVCVCVRE